MKHWKIYIAIYFLPVCALAQRASNKSIDLTGAIGKSESALSGSYGYNWKLGASKKWKAGLGLKLSSWFGVKKEFTTAPARLSRSTKVPVVVYFANKQEQNIDTLTVQRPLINSINISANVGYTLNRWQIGLTLDLIGYSFGRTTSGILTSNGYTRTEASAKPAAFNLLLTGNNNYGTLYSELFLSYELSKRWSVTGAYDVVSAEYKTSTIKQKAPDGSIVHRFRYKAGNAGVGVTYHLK